MRIANIIEESRFGGPQKRMLLIAHELEKNTDVSTHIFSNSENNETFRNLLNEKGITNTFVNIVRPSKNMTSIVKYLLFFIFDIIKIYIVLSRNKFDIVHVSGGSVQVKTLIAARLTRAKVIWHLNDTYAPGIVLFAFKFLSKLPNGFIFASERTKDYYAKSNKAILLKPFSVIPSPIDPKLTNNLKNYNKPFILKNFKNEGIVVGSVGNISPVKGYEVLVNSCVQLEKQIGIPISINILGNIFSNQFSYSKKLKILLDGSNVKLNIIQGSTNIMRHLKELDVFVCSSHYESSPMAVWEALAAGCLVVSSNVGDVDKYIDNQFNGYIYQAGNIIQLTEILRCIVCEEIPLEQVRSRASVTASEKLNVKVITERTLKFYLSLID